MPQLQQTPDNSEVLPTGNTEHTRPENRLYFPALDGLRTLAVALVFFGHYVHMPWGYTGVTLFFVLSGFLITGILFDSRDQPHRARNFYIRRTLRIFPLYYGVFLLLLLLTPFIHSQWTAWWWAWPAYLGNLLYLAPHSPTASLAADAWLTVGSRGQFVLFLGHFWSLCLEEQFYLVWPWVVFVAYTQRRLVWICVTVILLSPVARIVVGSALPHQVIDILLSKGTLFRLDSLLIGGLLALLIRTAHRDRVLLLANRFLLAASLVVIPAFLIALSSHWDTYTYPYSRLTWGESLLGLYFAALVAAALSPGTLVFRLFSLRPFRSIGRITYGIYVFHDIPHNLYRGIAHHLAPRNSFFSIHIGFSTLLTAIPCTLVLAWLSFRFFEAPFLDLKERWAPSHRLPNPPLAAAQLTSQPS